MTEPSGPATTLVFSWGNPGRGDDALGPLFNERFACLVGENPEWGAIDFLTDFQLQVEHALDLAHRVRVLFVDASIAVAAPCGLERIAPARDYSFSSHALSPQAVLQVYCDLTGQTPPAAWLLAIRGECFELGACISMAASQHLEAALSLAGEWLVSGQG